MSSRPERTCVGCRKRAAKDELLRVVTEESRDGLEVTPDPRGRAPGRGAHLHPTPDCLELALRRRAFARALRIPSGPGRGPGARLGTQRLERWVSEHGVPGDCATVEQQGDMTEAREGLRPA